ncbi:MAG: putative serine/threonine protein kinase [Gemmatimonadetes bacterium]|nr:putative serine/threonine protein kinase [Gemmatimonadota bacterium]
MTTNPLEIARALAGQFTILREIGQGGMGVVYLARDDKLDRPVALKVLPSDSSDTVARERFLREGRTAARLAHPNIVPIYRADEMGGIAFFTMAFVDGESLADRVRDRGPLQPADAVRILREVAWALAYAHARGVVHRDVKPENVLLERATGRALVTDFGIAHTAEGMYGEPKLTQAGAVLGTLQYMSPEQVAGETLDGRSDLYSLGVVAFFMLSGKLPFGDFAGAAVIIAHATRQPPSLRDVASEVPAALARVVDRCLAKNPDDRYATGEALADAFERALTESPALPSAAAVADDRSTRLSETEANAIWRRAAQLQADALRRLESRADLLTQPSSTTSVKPLAASDASSPDDSGYAIAHVVAAAQEAGISNQYVAMAMAERPQSKSGHALAAVDPALGVSERTATLYLGTQERSLAVTHVVEGTPARTLRVLGTVLQQMPYQLKFRETVGAHPLDGGVMVFDLPILSMLARGAPEAVNLYWMGASRQLLARQVQVTLRRLPGDKPRTEVTMTCDLRTGVRRNVRVSQWFAGAVGAVAALGSGILATGPAAAAVVGVGMAAATFAWYRWLYPGVFEKARGEMLNSLVAVGAVVRSEDVFGALTRDTIP